MSTIRDQQVSDWSQVAEDLYQKWVEDFRQQTSDRIAFVTQEDLRQLRIAAYQESERLRKKGLDK